MPGNKKNRRKQKQAARRVAKAKDKPKSRVIMIDQAPLTGAGLALLVASALRSNTKEP